MSQSFRVPWLLGCALALTVGCSKDRSEGVPPVAAVAPAAASSSVGDDAQKLCGAKSTCPNEAVDDEGTMVCTSLARDAVCGAKFLALVKCQIAKEKCGADGKVDQTATIERCRQEETALQACEQAKAKAATKASAK